MCPPTLGNLFDPSWPWLSSHSSSFSFFYTSFTQFHHFLLPPCSSALSALIMLDINEPALKMGEEMVLAGYKCALWPLPVAGCGLAPLRWGAVVAARLSSTSRKSTSRSSGVIPFQVALPKAPAPPAVVPHLSRLMRTQAWRSPVRCCSH